MKRFFLILLCLLLLCPCLPEAEAYSVGEPFRAQLDGLIRNETRKNYVQMMLDYYMRTDTMVQMALREKGSAVFLFEGCSDNMDHPDLMDISYYRVSAVCIAVRLDEYGEPYIAYFNDCSSTLPDRPLDYGSWHFEDVGDVGPATVCDGTYELYSVLHGGAYEALHVRTDYSDGKISAVYMTPDGYVKTRATEINVHTRTGNHVLEHQMWSAGCMLVGDGVWGQYAELMESTYYAMYSVFEVDRYVGSLTINRQLLTEPMYLLYESEDAVDRILAVTRAQASENYLKTCERKIYDTPLALCARASRPVMTLPCSNFTDARSVAAGQVRRGQELQATGEFRNAEGRIWYEVTMDGKNVYLYSGYAEESSWRNWITRVMA